VSILTDAEGHQRYCAVLCFLEPVRLNSPNRNRVKTRTNSVTATTSKDSDLAAQTVDTLIGDDNIDDSMCKVDTDEENGDKFTTLPEKSVDKAAMYAPKCLAILSRVKDFRVLKVMLSKLAIVCVMASPFLAIYLVCTITT